MNSPHIHPASEGALTWDVAARLVDTLFDGGLRDWVERRARRLIHSHPRVLPADGTASP